MKQITEIPATIFPKTIDKKTKLKVAAYCRVSTEKDEQEHSLETQISYFSHKIESNINWTMVDVFVDFGVSGLNDTKRTEFMRMIDMCNQGKIDLILTKSISRFARNNLDCLKHIRNLKSKNIAVFFEKEGINTLEPASEMFLSLYSSFAQAESESLSLNVTRGKRMEFKEGRFYFPNSTYGYVKDENNEPLVVEDEAKIIRKIFHMYLEGMSMDGIKKWLIENGIPTPKGSKKWGSSTVAGILKNEKYKGDVLLQKTYTVDYLTKTKAINRGEVTQYYIEDNHQGIVSKEIFDMVQNEIQRRANIYCGEKKSKHSSVYALTGKVVCGECGSKYRRVTRVKRGNKKIVWRCIERLTNGTRNCKQSPTILEEVLHKAILDSIKGIIKNTEDIKETVKREIESVIFKNDVHNPQVIKKNIRQYEKELNMLRNILKGSEDKEFYVNKIRNIELQIKELNKKLENAVEPDVAIMKRINKFIDDTGLNMNEYFNQMVRMVIDTVTVVRQEKIKIKYVDGTEEEVKI